MSVENGEPGPHRRWHDENGSLVTSADHPEQDCSACGHASDCATHAALSPDAACDCGKVLQDRMRARFITAAGGKPPTDEQREGVRLIGEAVVNLAALIEIRVPDGRNKSIALTALEDVQMRANRGIFADGGA